MPDTSSHPQGKLHTPGPKVAEPTDVSTRGLRNFLLIVIASAVVIHLALFWLQRSFFFHFREEDQRLKELNVVPGIAESLEKFPEPRLQTNPRQNLEAFRAREESMLTQYGWVNSTNGVVRVPIERAMELLLQRGLPVDANGGVSPLELQQQRPLQREKSPP